MNPRVRSFFKIVGFVAVLIVLLNVWNRSFVVYEPMEFSSTGEIRTAPLKNTPQHSERFKFVLSHNGEDWKTNSGGQVLIRRSLARDRELLANYSGKADDRNWLENAKRQK